MASMVRIKSDDFAALVAAGKLDALREPRRIIELERRGARATCWLGEDTAFLLVPEQPGWFRGFVLEPDELPVALLRAVGAQESPRPDGGAVRFGVGELATALARAERGEWVAPPLDGFRAHWRASAGTETVEVVETAQGTWSVEPDGDSVVLWPVDAAWVFGAISRLGEHAHA